MEILTGGKKMKHRIHRLLALALCAVMALGLLQLSGSRSRSGPTSAGS